MNYKELELSRDTLNSIQDMWAGFLQKDADKREIDPVLWALIYAPLNINQAAIIARVKGYGDDVSQDLGDVSSDDAVEDEGASYFASVCDE